MFFAVHLFNGKGFRSSCIYWYNGKTLILTSTRPYRNKLGDTHLTKGCLRV